MRRVLLPLLVVLGLILLLPPASAPAQEEEAPVRLTLLRQSPWTGLGRPLELAVRATNRSEQAFESLSLVLTIEAPARSRSVYELSLRTQATSSLFAYPFARPGTLQPGQSRDFTIRQELPGYLEAQRDSALYPLEVQLLSEFVPVGTLRSPMVFLSERPQVPLNLAWSWVLAAPLQHGPDDVFLSGHLEADIAPDGRIAAMVDALERVGDRPVTLAVSPVLLGQLELMAGGYRVVDQEGTERTVGGGEGGAANAVALLDRLRALAGRPATEVVALPFGDPSIPALFEAGLGHDLSPLLERGRAEIEEILQTVVEPAVFRPPFSHLDPGTLARLADVGVEGLLLDPGFLPAETGQSFSPPAVVRLSGGGADAAAIVPDTGVAARIAPAVSDPRLAAHTALGQLAAIWFEFPGTPGRGAAVLFDETPEHPVAFYTAFAELVASSPWLAPRTSADFVDAITPKGAGELSPRSYPGFTSGYVVRLLRARTHLRRFGESLENPAATTARLDRNLLLAEAGTLIGREPLGNEFVDYVLRAIRRVYEQVVVVGEPVTLTSRVGSIPVTIRNDADRPLRVSVRLVADLRLDFVEGDSREVLLLPDTQTLLFDVRARTTGRFPIKVQVLTPGGSADADTIAEAQVLVRSTAYNRVALVLTVGAALFLLVWWGRRLLPRRRT